MLRWVLWDNHKMSSQVGMTRFLMNFLPEDKRPQEVIGFMQGRLKAAFAVLDGHLAGRDWVAGDALSSDVQRVARDRVRGLRDSFRKCGMGVNRVQDFVNRRL